MDDIQHFAKLIKKTKFAMMTTVSDEDGSLQSRPMSLQEAEFDGSLWFFTRKSSSLVKQINHNPKVNLSFSNIENNSYVSASGPGEMLIDHQKAKELWNPFLKAWFPEGLEDPELCLIKVTVESADYWESASAPLVKLVGFAKAILSGKKADSTVSQHGHLNLN